MVCLALVLALTLLPLPALAQGGLSSSSTDLEQRIRQKKTVVQPRPAPDTLTRDANRAVDELAAGQRLDQTLRELNRPSPRRPDLDATVSGAIQTRSLQRALPH